MHTHTHTHKYTHTKTQKMHSYMKVKAADISSPNDGAISEKAVKNTKVLQPYDCAYICSFSTIEITIRI